MYDLVSWPRDSRPRPAKQKSAISVTELYCAESLINFEYVMTRMRPAAVAGTWYPGSAAALEAAVDRHLSGVPSSADVQFDELVAVIAPHAGLVYSGDVAACAYDAVRGRSFDVMVLVGPSHFVSFDGVSVCAAGAFQTPLGGALIDESCAAALLAATPLVRDLPAMHVREHSLEMQLPFIQRVAPRAKIVPL